MRSLMPAVFVTALACASGSTASDVAEITPGEPFRLGVGEAMRLSSEDLLIRFEGVAGDSRCPTGVNCFWAGDAAVEVRAVRGDEEAAVTLHTHGGPKYPREARVFDWKLSLEDLQPQPSAKGQIAPEDYQATLELTADQASE